MEFDIPFGASFRIIGEEKARRFKLEETQPFFSRSKLAKFGKP